MTEPFQVRLLPLTREQIGASLARTSALLTPEMVGSLQPYVRAESAAAAALTEEQYWGWDRQYGRAAGVAAPTLVDLTEQGACGGGGCNPSYSNSQFWRANVACSADVYARVLFQSVRYRAAQLRLRALLANPPQAWPGQMYFADPQDADGCSTTLPMRPGNAEPLSSKAYEWAAWCIDVMRNVGVARWASGVRWSESVRAGADMDARGLTLGGLAPGGSDNPATFVYAGPDSYGHLDAASTRPITLSEMGTIAGCVGQPPTLIDLTSGNSPPYIPDVAESNAGSYGRVGYFRPTSPRGLGPARWTWGIPAYPAANARYWKPFRGLSEPGRSPIAESAAFFARWRTPDGQWPLLEMSLPYTGTWLQLSEVLATRHGNASGPHTYVMPEERGDFDPVITPQIIEGGTHLLWPDDLAAPSDTTPGGILQALFRAQTKPTSGAIDNATLAELATKWQLHWSSAAQRFLPSGLRQIWWCMGMAYDVVDTSMGAAVSQAFGNFATGLNQIPPLYRTTNPTEGAAAARAANQATLDAIFAGCSAAAGAIAAAGTAASAVPAVGVALQIVAALVAVAGALAQQATAVGLARAGNPPVMPTIMVRVAGSVSATDPCWLVPSRDAGGGGAAAMLPRAQAVQQAAATPGAGPEQWYAAVQAQMQAGGPPTSASVNKGVALAGGAIAGLALIKLLGG